MNATPSIFGGSRAAGRAGGAGRVPFGQASTSAMDETWSALHDAAGVVAALARIAPTGIALAGIALAGIAPEIAHAETRGFPAAMRNAGGWRRNLAEQGIVDLTAIMQPGLAALLAAHARGADAAQAALALYEEFVAARDALLTLAPQCGVGPMRIA